MTTPVKCNLLLAKLRLDSIDALMEAYDEAGYVIRNSIDGGAGAGFIAKKMRRYTEGTVYAFEPFPGNHRFYTGLDGIKLHKTALSDQAQKLSFFVKSTVDKDSAWGKRGMEGYSSTGYLVGDDAIEELMGNTPEAQLLNVECEAADEAILESHPIDAVKLDLQGGELGAIKGMQRILGEAKFLWIEYTGQEGLLAYLRDKGCVLFDTDYLFYGEPTEAMHELFDIDLAKLDIKSSTGKSCCYGYPKQRSEEDFETWFREIRKSMRMIQTDIVAIPEARLSQFVDAVGALPFPKQPEIEAKPASVEAAT